MATKARLKFNLPIPWSIEHRMVTKMGFSVQTRTPNVIIFEKRVEKFKPKNLEGNELPPRLQEHLMGRIRTICGHFGDPEEHIPLISTRLENIAKTLPEAQQQFIFDWMDLNLKEGQ